MTGVALLGAGRAMADAAGHAPIHIALTFDDNYWAPAYATMRSICMVSPRATDIVFHLLHVGLSDRHQADIEAVTTEFGARIVYYDLDALGILKQRIAALPRVGMHINTPIVYARLFLTDIVPSAVERLIFIDSDMMVRAPIEHLADLDLEGFPLAAASDPYRTGFQTGRDLKPKRYYSTRDLFFNAGLLVIDTRKMAQVDIVGSILQLLSPDEVAGLYYDQDILNIVFRNNWRVLDKLWNLQNPLPAHEVLDPFVVHYTGIHKPWLLFKKPAFKRMYRHMMTNAYYYRYLRERLARRFWPGWLVK
ncbi:MAG: glycosyltransferase family 8 protein [Hyphomicrobiales bacterium]|nr:MAG: glycosyltransferase family 8 protein [Hyphomicrobiales bacterium]